MLRNKIKNSKYVFESIWIFGSILKIYKNEIFGSCTELPNSFFFSSYEVIRYIPGYIRVPGGPRDIWRQNKLEKILKNLCHRCQVTDLEPPVNSQPSHWLGGARRMISQWKIVWARKDIFFKTNGHHFLKILKTYGHFCSNNQSGWFLQYPKMLRNAFPISKHVSWSIMKNSKS